MKEKQIMVVGVLLLLLIPIVSSIEEDIYDTNDIDDDRNIFEIWFGNAFSIYDDILGKQSCDIVKRADVVTCHVGGSSGGHRLISTQNTALHKVEWGYNVFFDSNCKRLDLADENDVYSDFGNYWGNGDSGVHYCPAGRYCTYNYVKSLCTSDKIIINRDHTSCHDGDVWWFNSNNVPYEKIEDCGTRGCFGSGNCNPESQRAYVTFTIQSDLTPIKVAKIELSGKEDATFFSDINGNAKSWKDIGNYNYKITAEGYQSTSGSFTLESNGAIVNVNLVESSVSIPDYDEFISQELLIGLIIIAILFIIGIIFVVIAK